MISRPARPALAIVLGALAGALAACHRTPPRLVSPAEGAHVGGDSLTPRVEPEGEHTFLLDGQAVGGGSIPLAAASEGPHTLALQGPDGAALDSHSFTLDRTPPAVSIERPGPSLPADALAAGKLAVQVRVDDASPVTSVVLDGTPLHPVEGGRAGLYGGEVPVPAGAKNLTFSVTATDAVGLTTTTERTSTASAVRWAIGMPSEMGALAVHLDAAEDAVLLQYGGGYRLVDADGRDRWHYEMADRVPVESAFLPDGGIVSRVIVPGTPPHSSFVHFSPRGERTTFERPDWALTMTVAGGVPLAAFRTDAGTVVSPAPLPWPPSEVHPIASPVEARRLYALPGTPPGVPPVLVDGDLETVALAADGRVLWRTTHVPGAAIQVFGDRVAIQDGTGLRLFDAALGLAVATVPGPCTALGRAAANAITAICGNRALRREAGVGATAVNVHDAGVLLPADVRLSVDRRVAYLDDTVWDLDRPEHPLHVFGTVMGASALENGVVVVLAADGEKGLPPRAVFLDKAPEAAPQAEPVPLPMLRGVEKVLPLGDGAIVIGGSTARADHSLLVRIGR